jgi:hypothetical protein
LTLGSKELDDPKYLTLYFYDSTSIMFLHTFA